MKVKCRANDAQALDGYTLAEGYSSVTEFGLLEIGKQYTVMGILFGEGMLTYLVDDAGIVAACPFQLFDLVDNKLPEGWYFRQYSQLDEDYPYKQFICGYYELCFDDNHYEQLVEQNDSAMLIYFRRKREVEQVP